MDEKIEEAAEIAGPFVFALFPVLVAKGKAQATKGRVDFTYRSLAAELFTDRAEIDKGIEALVSAGVLTCPHVSARGRTVAFDPRTWRRWQEAARKSASREGVKDA